MELLDQRTKVAQRLIRSSFSAHSFAPTMMMTLNAAEDDARGPPPPGEDGATRSTSNQTTRASPTRSKGASAATVAIQLSPERLPPEPPEGSIEYKRQFVPRDEARRERLETQLRFRLDEGQGSALYELGVEDDGSCRGICLALLKESEAELKAMAEACDAAVIEVTRLKCVVEVDAKTTNIKCTSTGNNNGGKHHISSMGTSTSNSASTNGSVVAEESIDVLSDGNDGNGERWRSTVVIKRQASKAELGRTLVAPKPRPHPNAPPPLHQDLGTQPRKAQSPGNSGSNDQGASNNNLNNNGTSVSDAVAEGGVGVTAGVTAAGTGAVAVASTMNREGEEVKEGTIVVDAGAADEAAEASAAAEAAAEEKELSMHDLFSTDVRVAVCGNVDAGKSTCVGVLVKHKLDDGRGSVRAHVMRYPHEIDSGRTSAVIHHTINEKADGSGRRVTLVDLAGHEKYLRTTIYGFNSGLIDVALVLVNARKGPLGTTRHHLELAANLHTPVVVAVSKVDGCPPDVLASTGRALAKLLKQLFPHATVKPMKRLLMPTANQATDATGAAAGAGTGAGAGDAADSSQKHQQHQQHQQQLDGPPTSKLEEIGRAMPEVIPILPVSFVTGEGVTRLRRFVFALSARTDYARFTSSPLEFVADGVYTPPGVGPVLSGFVLRGTAKVGQPVHIGPRPDGTFILGSIRSIHIDRSLRPDAAAGSACCLAVAVAKKDDRRFLRRGLAVLSPPSSSNNNFSSNGPHPSAGLGAGGAGGGPHMGQWEFDARLFVVRGSSATLRVGYQPYAHIVMVRQTVAIVSVKVERSKKSTTDGEGGALEEEKVLTDALNNVSLATNTTSDDSSLSIDEPTLVVAASNTTKIKGSAAATAAAAAAPAVVPLESGVGYDLDGDDDDSGRRAIPSTQARRNERKDVARRQQVMHSGETGVVRFRFLVRPEFVRPGMRVMLREGKMRSVGEVIG